MRDQFLTYWRKRERTSIKKGLDLLKQGRADALVSTGNTGAVMAISKEILGTLKNIDRPALSVMVPTLKGHSLLIDVGANVDSKPKNLVQFALMGKVYLENVIGVKKPRIALMSIGKEDIKGNELTKNTFSILKKLDINFIGNIEGKDIHLGEADLIVTDGFTGNVTLKVSEGFVDLITTLLKEEIRLSLLSKIGVFFLKSSLKKIKKKLDYSEYGGALLLGVNGVVIIGHGRSNIKAIKNAIEQSRKFVEKKVVEKIGIEIANMEKIFKELKYV
jgi:glycerol-3-phosphate acyltransferase PlsX